jgi:hypothetical protein
MQQPTHNSGGTIRYRPDPWLHHLETVQGVQLTVQSRAESRQLKQGGQSVSAVELTWRN